MEGKKKNNKSAKLVWLHFFYITALFLGMFFFGYKAHASYKEHRNEVMLYHVALAKNEQKKAAEIAVVEKIMQEEYKNAQPDSQISGGGIFLMNINAKYNNLVKPSLLDNVHFLLSATLGLVFFLALLSDCRDPYIDQQR